MEIITKYAVVGGVAALVLAGTHHGGHRRCGGWSRRRRHGRRSDSGRFGGRQWQGLTEAEARTKLMEQLGDESAVDAAIDELDTRGYLAEGGSAG
ncbi:MAG: hypothetical protein ACR2QE_20325 [Acidimicrobiales bacterium]